MTISTTTAMAMIAPTDIDPPRGAGDGCKRHCARYRPKVAYPPQARYCSASWHHAPDRGRGAGSKRFRSEAASPWRLVRSAEWGAIDYVEGTVGLETNSYANTGSQLRIASELDGGTSYMRLEGEFDLACKETFRQRLLEVTADRPAGVIVDLSGLEFMDSSGLRMVVDAEALCRESGIDYGVIAGTGQARRVFDLTGMDDILPVLDLPKN